MKIAVLNGSPQGQHSITLTYFQFLKTRFPGNQYTIIHISKDIRVIEEDRKRFHEIVDIVDSSDAVLWLYGVWVLLVPAQMLRFIELIRERKADSVFVGKYAASISTSIHYLDHFAEQYIRAESENQARTITRDLTNNRYHQSMPEDKVDAKFMSSQFTLSMVHCSLNTPSSVPTNLVQ